MATSYDISRFPKESEEGQRYVIQLEPMPNEDELRVALIPSYSESVDDRYVYTVDAVLKERALENPYFPYYVSVRGHLGAAKKENPGNSTVKRNELVPIRKKKIVPYKSKRPLVVYLPEGSQLKYQIMDTSEMGYKRRKVRDVISTRYATRFS